MEDNKHPSNDSATQTAATVTVTVTAASVTESIDRKHASMLERLSKRHNSRIAEKPDPNSITTPPSFESTQSFLSQFCNSKLKIDSQIARIRENPDPTLKPELETISIEISAIDRLVADNSYFLPPYELRNCLSTIGNLKQSLDDVTSLVIPKKKFSFKNKPSKKPVQNDVVSETEKKVNVDLGNLGFTNLKFAPGFKAKENEVLVKEFNTSRSEGRIGEFTLSNLRDCEVGLKGCLRALFMDKLVNCRIYVGAVMGSVLIEGVEGCVFVLASHQIRIHNAKDCDFYLRVRSRPIIEDSSGVRFAPYCLSYEGIEKDLNEANLGEETGNWMNVDDFRWLRAVQSPNWSVLPENKRISGVDISNLGNVDPS